ncbi:MAG: hypothetical protein ACXVBE_14885 [Bdellovibrionota bacterium]
MKLFSVLLSLALSYLFLISAANAGFKGSISFTPEEKEAHAQNIAIILATAAECIQQDIAHHKAFFQKYGISAFYGDRSSFSKLTDAQKRAQLRSLGLDPNLVSQLAPTSCVGLTRKCLGRGFEKAGQAEVWKRINDYTILNDVDGTALQDGLQKLGWKIAYWNPDLRMNDTWDREEQEKNPTNSDHFWGYHQENWRAASGPRHKYYYNNVDDVRAFVNFGNHVPEAAKKIPFFVGTGHMGYHVFPITFGKVVEGHSTRAINDPKTLQASPFNPLNGQGPTEGTYKSGIVAVPPGYLN